MADQLKLLMVSLVIAGFFTVKDMILTTGDDDSQVNDIDKDARSTVPTLQFRICIG